MMSAQEDLHPHNHKLRMSNTQKNRLALEYIRMNEKPEDFLMHNRFLPESDSFASIYETSDEDSSNRERIPDEGIGELQN